MGYVEKKKFRQVELRKFGEWKPQQDCSQHNNQVYFRLRDVAILLGCQKRSVSGLTISSEIGQSKAARAFRY